MIGCMFGVATGMCSGVTLDCGRANPACAGPNGSRQDDVLRVAWGLLRPEQGLVAWRPIDSEARGPNINACSPMPRTSRR